VRNSQIAIWKWKIEKRKKRDNAETRSALIRGDELFFDHKGYEEEREWRERETSWDICRAAGAGCGAVGIGADWVFAAV
jgi:hypothetical protein